MFFNEKGKKPFSLADKNIRGKTPFLFYILIQLTDNGNRTHNLPQVSLSVNSFSATLRLNFFNLK